MTRADLKSIRQRLGLSVEAFATLVGVEAGRTVYRWEAGDRQIPGSVEIILELSEAVPEAREWLLSRAGQG